MSRPARVAFDIGGVLTKYPDVLRPLVQALLDGGAEVHVVTDMKGHEKVVDLLWDNGFKIPRDNVHCADFERYGEACKAKLLQQLEIDVFMDDFPAYLVEGCPVRLLVQPDLKRPYYHDTWKTDGAEGDFGRRSRVRRFVEEDRS